VSDDADAASEEPTTAPTGSSLNALVKEMVPTALNLGWWMAEAFHFATPGRLLHPDLTPVVPVRLANLSLLQPRDRFQMYIDGAEFRLNGLAQAVPGTHATPSAEPARGTLKTLAEGNQDAADHMLVAVNRLHIDILTWLSAIDRRLGMAYGLGRSLYTTRTPAASSTALLDQFDERIIEIRKWLDQLASALPPYSAGVVRQSLSMWAAEVKAASSEPESDARLRRLARLLPEQGDIWRSLLNGDLDGRALLESKDYAEIAEQVAMDNRKLLGLLSRRILFSRPARNTAAVTPLGADAGPGRGLPLITYIVLAVAVVLGVSVLAATGSPTARAAAALVSFAGGAVATWRVVSRPLNAAMLTVNRPLYDAQLTAHVACRISAPLGKAKNYPHADKSAGPGNSVPTADWLPGAPRAHGKP
jgi:hypothetical protein